jgi:glycosyltransferase involved in cell wall biosynthesis
MPGLLAASSVACSLFVDLPEMWNNSANKFFDALAASRPILINYRGWQAEILNRTGAGLVVPPGDPVAAAELLARFLRDGDRMARARTAAGRLADVEFNRERLAGEFISVLERVAAGRARSRSAERREAKR